MSTKTYHTTVHPKGKYYCYLLLALGLLASWQGWHTDLAIYIAAACLIASRVEP